MRATLKSFFLATLLLSLVSGQASQQSKDEQEHDPSDVLIINDQNWLKKIMHGGHTTDMLVFFEKTDCYECRRYGSLIAKLAKETNGSPQVSRAYCDLSGQHFCKAFQVSETPRIFLIREKGIFEYASQDGVTFDGLVRFISTEEYRETSVSLIIENYVREGERIESEEKAQILANRKRNAMADLLAPILPNSLQLIHSVVYKHFVDPILYTFGLDWLSRQLKCILWYFGVVIPLLLFITINTGIAIWDMFDNEPPKDEDVAKPVQTNKVKQTQPQPQVQSQVQQQQMQQPQRPVVVSSQFAQQPQKVKEIRQVYLDQAAWYQAQLQASQQQAELLKQFDQDKPLPQQATQAKKAKKR